MAGSQGQHPIRISGIYAHGPQAQRLSHGRAGSVKAEQRNFQIYRTEGSGNQLSQKIPCKEVTHLPPVNIFLLQRQICRLLLHGTLCLFPVFHSKRLILLFYINFVCQRSLAFLLSRDRSPGCHKCGMFKPQTCFSHLHKKTPFLRIPSELSMRKKGVFIFMDLCGQHFFFFLRCLIPQYAYSANQNQSDEVRQAARY